MKNRLEQLTETVQTDAVINLTTFSSLITRPKRMRAGDTVFVPELQKRTEGILLQPDRNDPDSAKRLGTEAGHLEHLKGLYQQGIDLSKREPIVIFGVRDENGVLLYNARLDGNHRIVAQIELYGEDTPINVEYAEGTFQQAQDASWGANAAHGRNLTTAEKDAMIRAILADERYNFYSDAVIADRLMNGHTSAKNVSNKRRLMEIPVEDGGLGFEFPPYRIDKQGRRMTVDDIGKKKAPAPANAPTAAALPVAPAPAPVVLAEIEVPDPVKRPSSFVSATATDKPSAQQSAPKSKNMVSAQAPANEAPEPPKNGPLVDWRYDGTIYRFDGEMVEIEQGTSVVVQMSLENFRKFAAKIEVALR